MALLKSERLAMQTDFAEALEKAVGIAETVKKHRARIDGAAGGRPPSMPAGPPPLESLTGTQVATLSVPEQLEWARRRALARARAS